MKTFGVIIKMINTFERYYGAVVSVDEEFVEICHFTKNSNFKFDQELRVKASLLNQKLSYH